MQDLNNKICVITGAARGIGCAITARFHNEGAIAITDIDKITGAATASEIGCQFEQLDVREEDLLARIGVPLVPTGAWR